MSDSERLAAIRQRATEAHAGPWCWHWRPQDEYAPGSVSALRDYTAIAMCPRYGKDEFSANAEFIVNARADVDFLLARVGELEAENERLRHEAELDRADPLRHFTVREDPTFVMPYDESGQFDTDGWDSDPVHHHREGNS